MQDFIIVGILAVLLVIGISSTVKHFKGKSDCCGGGNTYISKKKLKNVIAKKVFVVETVVSDDVIKAAIEKAGYEVVEIR